MKKILFVSLALLAMVAFVSEVSAAERVNRILGKVTAYEAGKVLKIYGGFKEDVDWSGDVPKFAEAEKKDWEFKITPATKVTGDIKEGSKVRIRYTRTAGGEMTAVSISKIGK